MLRRTPIALLLLGTVAPMHAQDPVIRIDVKLVQVDAVVTDSGNRHIGNLKAGDFEILQDGKPQTITNFSWIAPGAPPALTGGPGAAVAPQFVHAPPKAAEVHRMLALVVDDLALSSDGVTHVREALRSFSGRELRPGDMVAIIRTSAGMGALQQFTTDRAVLNAAIDQIKFTLGPASVSSFGATVPQSPEQKKFAAAHAASERFKSDTLIPGTLAALRYVIGGLHDMPGRKSVVLFSENLPLLDVGLRGITDAANRASVVINTIDPRGLQYFPEGRVAQEKKEAELADSQEGLAALARDTGGLFVRDNNRIDEALDEVVADTEGYYLIGYRPDSTTFDSKTGAPLYHKVQVRLRVAGLHVRSRSGFFGESDSARDIPLTAGAALRHALASPFSSGDVHIQLTTLFNQTPDKRSNLSALLHIDAHDLSFTLQPDGSRHARFEVAAEIFGVNGQHVDHSDRSFSIDLRPDQYEAALARGVVYVVNQPVRAPGMYQMRVALRDQTTERIGAANQFIDVPDLTKARLTLSSVLLRQDAQGALQDVNHVEGQVLDDDPATAAALRVFKPGSALSYDYFVFNAQSGSHKADLEVQTRLFRDGKLVYTGQPMVPALAGEVASGRLLAGGHMTLAKNISPGDYVLQVIVTDRLAKQKSRSASEAIDFEVLK